MNENLKRQFISTAMSVYRTFVFPFVKWRYVITNHIHVQTGGYFDRSTKLSTYNYIGRDSFLEGCVMGVNSAVGDNVHLIKTKMGNHCSVGRGTVTAIGEHRFKDGFATSSTFFSDDPISGLRIHKADYQELKLSDPEGGYCITMENDVWVGTASILFSGITLANGTVIGAGSIVTKSTEPYGIYIGAPAKLVGYRFDKEKINELLESKWWDMDFDELKEFAKRYD